MANIDNLQRRLRRCCTAINKILEEAQEDYPNATLYLDGTENLHLIDGFSHGGVRGDGRDDCDPNQDKILCTATLHAGGGDW